MTRKEMIETIAKQARCSKRLVRKKLFSRYLELKKISPNLLFYKIFLDRNTEWHDFSVEHDFRLKNGFDVFCVSSGCIVMFRNIPYMSEYGIEYEDECGAKLYSFGHLDP